MKRLFMLSIAFAAAALAEDQPLLSNLTILSWQMEAQAHERSVQRQVDYQAVRPAESTGLINTQHPVKGVPAGSVREPSHTSRAATKKRAT